MKPTRKQATNGAPFGWWGPFPRSAPKVTVLDLLREGVIEPGLAALLWAALVRRRSLTVVAGPSGAGKTTLLTALLDFLPTDLRRIYVRGCYEPFDFFADPAVAPGRTALLVNEISPHLPIYLWGPGVRQLLAAARDGFSVYATAHAGSARELVAALAGYPLRIPAGEVAALELVLSLDARWEAVRMRRRAARLEALGVGPAGGVTISPLANGGEGDVGTAATSLDPVALEFLGVDTAELVERARLLATMAADRTPVDEASDAMARLRVAARECGLLV